MINNTFKISIQTLQQALITWDSANADDVSYLYVNGVFRFGPMLFGTIAREALIPFSSTFNKKIEIHDFLAAESVGRPANVTIQENGRPLLIWTHITGAVRYRVFQQISDMSEPEEKIDEIFVVDNRVRYQVTSNKRLGEGWSLFRIESIDVFGNESTRFQWPYRVFRLPEPVNDLTIADGSGANLFDFTIS